MTDSLPSDCSPYQACEEVVEQWKATRYPDADLSREISAVAGRVRSWLAPSSVLAGVRDVFSAARWDGKPLDSASLANLGEALARRLVAEELLAGQARRVSPGAD